VNSHICGESSGKGGEKGSKRQSLTSIFSDYTSSIISNSDSVVNMNQDLKVVLEIMQRWFNYNRMLLNYNKTKFKQFLPNINHQSWDTTGFNTCKINSANYITFLDIITDLHEHEMHILII
jgi:hypothetical protein